MTRPRPGSRVAALAVAATAAALALAGCAASDDGPSGSGTLEPVGPELTGTLTVFAAASLTDTFDALAETFEQKYPSLDVVISYGGSSGLAAQITEGAPADVFAAASKATMTTVTNAGDASDPEIFASNTLELAVPAGNPAGVTGLADLADAELAIALCDVAVPCGAATQQLLDSVGVVAAPDTLEQDVKAVLTKVELGEADAGLVYVTDVQAAGDGVEGIEVPEAADVVTRYPIAVLTGAPNPDAAARWVAFVLSDAGQEALADAGFGPMS